MDFGGGKGWRREGRGKEKGNGGRDKFLATPTATDTLTRIGIPQNSASEVDAKKKDSLATTSVA